MRRRQFLVLSAASVGGILVYSLDRRLTRLSAQDAESIRIPLRFFTQSEALTIAAACARIFPAGDDGPGAREAGVVIFIDRQLGGPWGRDRYRYTQPPFDEQVPDELGYQGKATPREIYRQGLKELAGFTLLAAPDRDAKLKSIENGRFFNLLRRNTIEGMFCDPLHGGNVDMIGWQLIGFPGPRMSNAAEIEMYRGEEFRPEAQNLQQVTGQKRRGSEDEK